MIEQLVPCVVLGLLASAGFAGPPLKVCMVSGSFEYESDVSLEAFKTYIVGINWYLYRRVAIKLNYSHSDIDDAFGAPFASGLVDLSGANSVDSISGRLQVDW